MLHPGEKWQDFTLSGAVKHDGGYDSSLGNPDEKFKMLVGTVEVIVYRRTISGGIEVLFQKRSKYVDRNALKWDLSAGGHMNYKETVPEAAVREAKEEIGLEIADSDLQYVFSNCNLKDRNILRHFLLCDRTGCEDKFKFNDHEVAEVKWVPFEEFDDFMDKNVKETFANDMLTREQIKVWLKKFNGNL